MKASRNGLPSVGNARSAVRRFYRSNGRRSEEALVVTDPWWSCASIFLLFECDRTTYLAARAGQHLIGEFSSHCVQNPLPT